MPDRKQKTTLVAPGQQGIFIMSTPMPYGTDRVDHPRSTEPVTLYSYGYDLSAKDLQKEEETLADTLAALIV